MKEIKVYSLDETNRLGNRLGSIINSNFIITLKGDLGAGKTTFTKAIGKSLGVKKTINSPTFTILKTYYGKIPLHHIDAYRLEGITQDLGFEEIFDDEAVTIIEWPSYIETLIPKERLEIEIKRISDHERLFILHGIGSKYEEIERNL